MLIPADPGDAATLAAAVAAGQVREPTYRLLADWNRDGLYAHAYSDLTPWVLSLSTDRDSEGDLPEEATLVEGYIASAITATLGGAHTDGTHAIDAFGPYRPGSPFALVPTMGVPVTLDLGFTGTAWTRVFTGTIRGLDPDSGERTVTLTCLDPADSLRVALTVPAFAMNYNDMLASNHRVACNSQAVIDFILRRNGFHASPPTRDDAQLACTGHGWLVAETGRSAVPRGVAAVIEDDSWFLLDPDHPWDMLCVRGPWEDNGLYQEFFADESFNPLPGAALGVSLWCKTGTGMTDASTPNYRPMVQLLPLVDTTLMFELGLWSDGRFAAYFVDHGVYSGNVIPAATVGAEAWRYLGAHWTIDADGSITIRWRVNGVTYAQNFAAPGTMTATVGTRLQATVWTFRPWTNLQVWFGEPGLPTWEGQTHTASAQVDVGLGYFLHLPDVVEQESIEVIKDVVGAEFGLFGFSETGMPTFTNRLTATNPTSVDLDVTADANLIDLASKVTIDSVRNVVSAETVMGTMRFPQTVLESGDELEFQSSTGITDWDVPIGWGKIGTTTAIIPRVASASWNDTVTNGFVSVQAASPSTEITSGITVIATMIGDRLIRITVRNYSAFPVRFATTSGSPALRVGGWGVVLDPPRIDRVRSAGSAELYGERAYKLDADPWRQYWPPLQEVAGGLLATLSSPLPVLVNIPVTGDPRLQPADVIRVTDDSGLGSFRAYITGVRHTLDAGGAYQTELTVRPVAPPGLGLLDDTELGILDDTLVLAP